MGTDFDRISRTLADVQREIKRLEDAKVANLDLTTIAVDLEATIDGLKRLLLNTAPTTPEK
jgi:hypothetical protein